MVITAMEGLPMCTRCGAVDPGVLLYMQRTLGLSVEEVEALLYNESGLKGLSGISHDVSVLLQSTDPAAHFALSYFSLKTAQHIAAMAVSIGGIDALIFTGGIGEHAESIRQGILNHLCFLPAFQSLVIPANEEALMAMEVSRIILKNSPT